MKHLLLTTTVCLAAIPSTEASAELVFRGSIAWTAASNCQFEQARSEYASTYHPRLAGNADYAGLTYVTQFGGAGYRLAGADFSSKFRNVTAVGLGWDGFTFTGAQIKVTGRTFLPGGDVGSARFVTLTGQIKKPGGDLGIGGQPCIVTFEAAYRRAL